METPIPQKPRTMAELLPGLSGILTKDARQTATGLKQPRPTMVITRTEQKNFKPMTIAEMKADIKVLKVPSPRRIAQVTSTKKKWNSSVKVKKTISLTGSTQGNNSNSVRKVLNFMQQKPTVSNITTSHARKTLNPITPKFARPEIKAKKPPHPHIDATSVLSISGICHIEETPQLQNKVVKSRMTIANKENFSSIPRVTVANATPKSSLRKRVMMSKIIDTPLSNESWKSSCDDSFIQNEKDIELMENKTESLPEPSTLEGVPEKPAPASTPYKEYRSVNEYFDNSSYNNSTCQDNTIITFDSNSQSKDETNKHTNKREESVIVSLCDMLKKTTVSKMATENVSTDLDELLEVEKQSTNNLAMLENSIKMLNNIKESELKSLQSVRKLIKEKQRRTSESDNKTAIDSTKDDPVLDGVTPLKSQVKAKPCSVIKSCLKSPSYKIPKKITSSVRKKVHYKSLPNIASLKATPEKYIETYKDMGGKALSVYLQMKEHMNFLTTPAKQPLKNVMDTPSMASHNLQKQLDKLYRES